MSNETWKMLGAEAKRLVETHKDAKFSTEFDVKAWRQESHNLAPSAYYGAVENEPLPDSYISRNMPPLEVQLIKGGLRLAYLINQIFSSKNFSLEAPSANANMQTFLK